MKKLIHKPSLLIALLIVTASCSQIIDIDIPEHEPMWTFNGNICAGEIFYELENSNQNFRIFNYFISQTTIGDDIPNVLSLSKSIPISNRKSNHTFYDDGELFIFQGDNLVETPPSSVDNSFNPRPRYLSELDYEPEKTYRFKMIANDDTELSATQTIPKKVEPRNVRVNESSSETIVHFTIDDPLETNHYLFQCHEIHYYSSGNTSGYSHGQQEFNITSPNFFWYYEDFDFLEEGNQYQSTGVLSDADFNGQSHEIEMRINKNTHQQGMYQNKKIVIEISSMSFDMHRYFQSYAQTIFGFSPFSEPAILNFNVENGLGAVVAVTTTFLEIEIEL